MAQAKQGTVNGPSTKVAALAFGLGAAVAAAILVLALAVSSLSRPATGTATAGPGDAFTSAAAIEFRAAEHAVQAAAADPFVGTAAIEFRTDEHAAGAAVATADPLLTPQRDRFQGRTNTPPATDAAWTTRPAATSKGGRRFTRGPVHARGQFIGSPSPAEKIPMAPWVTRLKAWVTNGYIPSSTRAELDDRALGRREVDGLRAPTARVAAREADALLDDGVEDRAHDVERAVDRRPGIEDEDPDPPLGRDRDRVVLVLVGDAVEDDEVGRGGGLVGLGVVGRLALGAEVPLALDERELVVDLGQPALGLDDDHPEHPVRDVVQGGAVPQWYIQTPA